MSMQTIRFYFDPISPYSALAFEQLPTALAGCSYEVEYRPILFPAVLHAVGQRGPAEIAGKREWTYRQVVWQAEQLGIAFQMPAQHPFNPLPLLRLAWACGSTAGRTPSRHAVEQIFQHVWKDGLSAVDPQRLAELTAALKPAQDPGSEAIKEQLRTATEEAIKDGVFGVPSFELDGKIFWGLDSLPMLAACLRGDAFFAAGGPWDAAGAPRPGIVRRA